MRWLIWLSGIAVVAAGAVFYLHPLWVNDQWVRTGLRMHGVSSETVDLAIPAGKFRVHYYVAGEGQPVVLIHGLGGRGEDWAAMIPQLKDAGFKVYAIDLLGYGQSARPRQVTYSISLEVSIVRQFFEVLNIEQADVGGWSMGGWVALKFARDYPQLVRRLMVYDSAGFVFDADFGPDLFVPRTPEQLNSLYARLSPHARKVPGFLFRDIMRSFGEKGFVIQSSMNSMLTRQDLMDGKLGGLQMPVLIAWGGVDRLIPPVVGEEMHREVRQSVLELFDGCGHLAPGECADRVGGQTVRFLKSEPALSGGEFHY